MEWASFTSEYPSSLSWIIFPEKKNPKSPDWSDCGLTSEGPDDEGLRIRLNNALQRERFARRAAQHREAGEDGGGDCGIKL